MVSFRNEVDSFKQWSWHSLIRFFILINSELESFRSNWRISIVTMHIRRVIQKSGKRLIIMIDLFKIIRLHYRGQELQIIYVLDEIIPIKRKRNISKKILLRQWVIWTRHILLLDRSRDDESTRTSIKEPPTLAERVHFNDLFLEPHIQQPPT